MHHYTKFDVNPYMINMRMHATINIFWCNQQSQDVKLELLHHYVKVDPDQIKSVDENEANRFCFALTLWSQARSRPLKAVYSDRSQW